MKEIELEFKNPDMYSFGKYIKKRRNILGKSLRNVASEVGMAAAYLNEIELGKRYAPFNYLDKLQEALSIPVDETSLFYSLAYYGNVFEVEKALKENPLALQVAVKLITYEFSEEKLRLIKEILSIIFENFTVKYCYFISENFTHM